MPTQPGELDAATIRPPRSIHSRYSPNASVIAPSTSSRRSSGTTAASTAASAIPASAPGRIQPMIQPSQVLR